jgi:hypothetical protein
MPLFSAKPEVQEHAGTPGSPLNRQRLANGRFDCAWFSTESFTDNDLPF